MAPSNPDAVIDSGGDAAPVLPGGPTAGVGPDTKNGFWSTISGFINENQTVLEFGMGVGVVMQTHHLIELRFAERLGFKKIPTIELTPDEHQKFTNMWRDEIPYKNSHRLPNTETATRSEVWKAARKVYKEFPELLDQVRRTIFFE